MTEWLSNTQNWVALLQIIWINILLSGDNAVVIALACRTLPAAQQRLAIFFGATGAIVLRVVLTWFAVVLLSQPYLKLAGSLLLLWIAVKLLLPQDDGGDDVKGSAGMMAAIKTIVIADFVMSLDNVLGVAAAAKGDIVLLILGLLISMPLIVYGSTLILKLMSRFPIVITLGAAILGYVAGDLGITDDVIAGWVEAHIPAAHIVVPLAAAVLVVIPGKLLARRRLRTVVEIPVDEEPRQTPRP